MTGDQIRILASIAASNARVLGMLAENMQRQTVGQSMAYVEGSFAAEAALLDGLAMQAANS